MDGGVLVDGWRSTGRWMEEYWSVVCTYTARDVEE